MVHTKELGELFHFLTCFFKPFSLMCHKITKKQDVTNNLVEVICGTQTHSLT